MVPEKILKIFIICLCENCLLLGNENTILWIQKDIGTHNLTWFTSLNNILVLLHKVTCTELPEYVDPLTMVKSVWFIRVLIFVPSIAMLADYENDKTIEKFHFKFINFYLHHATTPEHYLYTCIIMFFIVCVNMKKIKNKNCKLSKIITSKLFSTIFRINMSCLI